MPFSNPTATATPEQAEAAKETIKLVDVVEKFIQQSHSTEKSNHKLTIYVILLSIIQAVAAILALK
jgi:hypothetical protein